MCAGVVGSAAAPHIAGAVEAGLRGLLRVALPTCSWAAFEKPCRCQYSSHSKYSNWSRCQWYSSSPPCQQGAPELMDPVVPYRGQQPSIGQQVFIAPGAIVIGNVKIGPRSSIWYNTVLRGDVDDIVIGECTNIQDGCILHVTSKRGPGEHHKCVIGDWVTVGHGAVVHAAQLQDECLVGIRSVLLDGAVVESHAMVAAGAVVPPGKVVRSGEVWAGTPARKLRNVTDAEREHIRASAEHYFELAQQHVKDLLSLQEDGTCEA